MNERLQHIHQEYTRYMLLKYEPGLVRVVGPLWLWRHGVQSNFPVYPWKTARNIYQFPLSQPFAYKAVEVGESYDPVMDHQLRDKGWTVLRITDEQLRDSPEWVRLRVRGFFKS